MEHEQEREDVVTLVDDDGVEHDFEVIDIFPVDARQYAVLVPVRYNGEEEEVDGEPAQDAYIFRVEKDGESGEDTLVEVDDEGEWNKVALEWENRIQALEEEEGDDL